MKQVSVSLLHDLLILDTAQGKLYWKKREPSLFQNLRSSKTWNSRYASKEAFTTDNGTGYGRAKIFDDCFLAHRVVWAMVHGAWPEGGIDHIDGNRRNNRPSNLRSVPPSENSKNREIQKNNTSGVNGVAFCPRTQKWRASIMSNRKTRSLGYYDKFEEAVAARKTAEREFGFSETHGRAKPAKVAA